MDRVIDDIRFDAAVLRGFTASARAAGWIAALVSLAVLAGWLGGAEPVQAWLQSPSMMRAHAALGCLLAGSALLLHSSAPRTAVVLSALTALLGGLELLGHAFGPGTGGWRGLDLLAPGWPGRPPARMTELAAVALLLLGVVGVAVQRGRAVWLREACAIAVIAIAMAAFASCGLVLAGDGAGLLQRLPAMTASVLLLLTLGWMASAPTTGLTRVAAADSQGGAFARRLILPALVLPVLFTFLFKAVQLRLGMSESLALALAAVAAGGAVAAMIIWVASLLDRAERQWRVVLALHEDARTDALTGLANRRALDAALVRALRQRGAATLLLLDVDHFKRFNDSFGHPAGDDVLRETGRLLRAVVRSQDLVARYGGEEFAILLQQSDALRGRHVAERVIAAMRVHPWALRPVTLSIGVAVAAPGDAAATLLRRADAALYRSKQAGRDRFSFGAAPGDEAPPHPQPPRRPPTAPPAGAGIGNGSVVNAAAANGCGVD